MFALSLPVLIALASFAIGILRWIYTTFFSKNAKADAMLAWAERQKARLVAERDRLRAAIKRIDAEPPKQGQDLIDDLNRKFGGKQ
jgi:cell division protein FtsB